MRRSYLVLGLATLSIFAVLVSIPQTAPQRQRLYHYAFTPSEDKASVGAFDEFKWGFQLDMPWYKLPQLTAAQIEAAPRYWQGAGHETYATFYATRNASDSDPYFLATQQVVYRVLWDPQSKTEKHPMTVFVAPFITEEHRDYFRAAGAIVRELAVREFTPLTNGSAGRLRDMFTKLEMWSQTDYSKILYLDSDAFPLTNVDEVFDMAPVQQCKQELLPPEDVPRVDEICPYVFTGYADFKGVNAGVMVFSPNKFMHERLIRESLNQSQFDNGYMEQALLNVAFQPDGPFPPSYIDHAYNGGVNTLMRGDPLYIVHHKLWVTKLDPPDAWYYNTFNTTWLEMLDFYRSSAFIKERQRDNATGAFHR